MPRGMTQTGERRHQTWDGTPRGEERLKIRLLAIVAAATASLLALPSTPLLAKSLLDYRHILLDGHRVKWGIPRAGTGAVITYATLNERERFPAARNCGEMVALAPLLAANHVDNRTFQSELRVAFDLWSAAANIRFEPAASVDSADILIGAQAKPRGRAFTNIEFDRAAPAGAILSLTRSMICLSPAARWKTGFDGNLDVYDLRYTLLHEIGHAIGLDHPAIQSQLMDFRYNEKFRAPQEGDVRGVVALYGMPSEPGLAARETSRSRVATARPAPIENGG